MDTSDKEILRIRNKIFVDVGIRALEKIGFEKEPFQTSWFGRNNLGDFTYEFGRLDADLLFQLVQVHISKGDRWIKTYLNLVRIQPSVSSIEELRNYDSFILQSPEFSKSQIRIGIDDIKGIPLLNWNFMFGGHRLKRFANQEQLSRQIARLSEKLQSDLGNMDYYVKRWHELHIPLVYNLR